MREAITPLAPSSNQSQLMRNNQQLKSEGGKQLNWQNGKCHHERSNNKGINELQLPMHFFEAIRQLQQSSAFALFSESWRNTEEVEKWPRKIKYKRRTNHYLWCYWRHCWGKLSYVISQLSGAHEGLFEDFLWIIEFHLLSLDGLMSKNERIRTDR